MLRRLIVFVLLSAPLAGIGCDQLSGDDFIEADSMIEVTLATEGQVVELPFRLSDPSHVAVRVYFPPTELGHVSTKVIDATGNQISLRGKPSLPSGLYKLVVSAKGASPDEFNVKVATSPQRAVAKPAEDELPNANTSVETAVFLPLPDTRILRVDQLRPQHWFRFEADEDGFVMAMLKGLKGSTPLAGYALQDSEGRNVDSRPINSGRGNALYARISAGTYYMKVFHEPAGEVGVAGTEMVLTTRLRSKDYRAHGGVGVLTMGVAEGSGTHESLRFIADATGLPLISTFTADDIQWVLAKAIGDELGPSPAWAMLGIFVLLLEVGWLYRWTQRSGARVMTQLGSLELDDSLDSDALDSDDALEEPQTS